MSTHICAWKLKEGTACGRPSYDTNICARHATLLKSKLKTGAGCQDPDNKELLKRYREMTTTVPEDTLLEVKARLCDQLIENVSVLRAANTRLEEDYAHLREDYDLIERTCVKLKKRNTELEKLNQARCALSKRRR